MIPITSGNHPPAGTFVMFAPKNVRSTARNRRVSPTVAGVHDASYPLARSLHVYTLGEPQGAVKAYIDWILSEAGQKIVEDAGYVPLPPAERPKP